MACSLQRCRAPELGAASVAAADAQLLSSARGLVAGPALAAYCSGAAELRGSGAPRAPALRSATRRRLTAASAPPSSRYRRGAWPRSLGAAAHLRPAAAGGEPQIHQAGGAARRQHESVVGDEGACDRCRPAAAAAPGRRCSCAWQLDPGVAPCELQTCLCVPEQDLPARADAFGHVEATAQNATLGPLCHAPPSTWTCC